MTTGGIRTAICAIAGVAAMLVAQAALAQEPPARAAANSPLIGSCGPVNGFSFVCGLKNPEDLALVPGTRWLVASGMAPGGGLRLVDTAAKTARMLYAGGAAAIRPDAAQFPHCPGAPDPAVLNTHGIALRPTTTPGVYRLLAVSHGALEAVQVFALDARGDEPTAAWIGCVPMPANLRGNAVTGFADGEMLVTVQGGVGATGGNMFAGAITGAVFSWKPGDATFRPLAGTELSGPNGIEASPDEKEFYVATSGTQTVAVFSRADTRRPLRQVRAPFFNLDNLRWTNGRLIAAGMMYDEPACGGTRQEVAARGGNANGCIRGFVAAELDPKTMGWRVIGYAEPNPVFGGIATAVIVGDLLWISSYNSDRVAYRPLAGPR